MNLVKLTTTDNEPPEVTGGYISKADKQTGGDPIAWEMPSYTGPYNMVYYIHDQPKPDIITNEQHIYIRNYFFCISRSNGQWEQFTHKWLPFNDRCSFIY